MQKTASTENIASSLRYAFNGIFLEVTTPSKLQIRRKNLLHRIITKLAYPGT